jgi:FkbH-like protein
VKLIRALELLRQPVSAAAPELKTFLACGSTPLHLQTFLGAELRTLLPDHRVSVQTGLFGDLIGNVERLDPAGFNALAVLVEWSDLDSRLGVRNLGGWRPASLADIAQSTGLAMGRLRRALTQASRFVPTVVSMPTLPLPPVSYTHPAQASSFEMRLREAVAALASSLAEEPGIRIVNPQRLDEASPHAGRFDIKSDLATGFPYSLSHAASLGEQLSRLLQPASPKKGLITDLDDTLWAGILGEEGPQGISWHLEHHTQGHGLYQQLLASLASTGVLIAVASKNDPSVVEKAFDREDLLISRRDIFPSEVHWSRKSESVRRILETWNVAADSVVFIDDSPLEVAEVQAVFPELECVVFPKGDDRGVWDLLKHLRDLFGKPFLQEEDALRLDSIRNAGAWQRAAESGSDSSDDFLNSAEASIVFDCGRNSEDMRAFELINKTNQFNLNGKRFSEQEWRSFLADRTAFLLTASYKDKYGPLGKVVALLGRSDGRRVCLTGWVMSCRAFSRRIEHQCLNYLFETFGVNEIVFEYEQTPRNGPLQDFLTELLGESPASDVRISREQFATSAPRLFHLVERAVSA